MAQTTYITQVGWNVALSHDPGYSVSNPTVD